MGDYVPHIEEGPFTFTASAAITGGQLLKVTGVNTVGPTTGATSAWIGVAAFDAAIGEKVTVLEIASLHRLLASGTVTAGDQVVPAAAGAVQSLAAAGVLADLAAASTAINSARQVVGTALTTATDASVDIFGK